MHLEVVIGLLVAALVLAIAAKRVRIPYNVALVVGGMLLAVGDVLPLKPHLSPEVVFLVCLPALLFEGGITADLSNIRSNLVPIALLSTVGMGIAILATGVALHFVLALPILAALLLGCILSVTDTVSVLYAFRRVRVPARLSGMMQGESLFNDGTALVAYGAITVLIAGAGEVALPSILADVVLATVGGLVVGLACGLSAGFVIRRTEDPLAEVMATTALAYAAYSGAEHLHVSGAIAAVAAGLSISVTIRRDCPPSSQLAIHTFWEYVAFGVNTFLFLSVGLATSFDQLLDNLAPTLLAIGSVFAGRAVAVYLPFALLRAVRRPLAIPARWQHVFVLGNIKGALSIALALGLPASTPSRELIINTAFGVTFFSLIVQGLSLTGALRWLGLIEEDQAAALVGAEQARVMAGRAAQQELERLHRSGLVPKAAFERLRSEYQVRIAGAERELRRLYEQNLAWDARALLGTRQRLVEAERTAVQGALRTEQLPERVAHELLAELDERMLQIEHDLTGGGDRGASGGEHPEKRSA